VLDLTRFLSGPYCTLLLAGMGARVIKIDDPAGGDPTASAPPFAAADGIAFDAAGPGDLGLAYLKRARGKESLTLNLKDPRGVALLLELAQQADVVVENFRPGVAQRLGVDHAVLERHNPRIVSCAINGFGSDGPDRDLKSYDLMAQAASGLMGITGEPDGPPAKIATAFSDMLSGTYAALAILGALQERERSGQGQAVEVSMVDCLFAMMMDEPLDCYERLGLAPRQGNRIMRFSPFNAYRARDGWVVIGAQSLADWQRLARTMGRDDLADHPDYRRVQWRVVNNEQVDALVQQWAAGHDVATIMARLREADVACSPVRTPLDAIAWPQLADRGMVRPLRRPDGSATSAVTADLPMRFSRSRVGHAEPAPVPGAHTHSLLSQMLGLDAQQLAGLADDGVI
jgi:formyl-CoA transferase